MNEDSYLDTWMEGHLSHGYDAYEDDYDPFGDLGYDEDEDDEDDLAAYEPSPRGRGDLGEL